MFAWCGCCQSPDSAKVKEELARLSKRLKAGQKAVEDKERRHTEQRQTVAKLQSDLEHIADGARTPGLACSHVYRHR